jgi:uncharacterized membrane-anchored protein
VIEHKHSDLVAHIRAHASATADEKAAERSSAAVERAKAAATTGPAALLDLADKAARVRGGPFPVTPVLDAALRALQDRIAARLLEVLA